jgi:hypothetical protein
MSKVLVFFLLLLIAQLSDAFLFPTTPRVVSIRSRTVRPLQMSDQSDAALEALKAKMAADPNFDPMKDPQSLQLIESLIPDNMRELSNSIARLEVAYKDATGSESEDLDIDASAVEFTNKKDLISSPSSQYFKISICIS